VFRAAKRRIPAHFGALTSSERLDQHGPSERLHARIAPHGPPVPTRVPKALKVLPSIK